MWNRIVKNALWLTGGEMVGRILRASLVIYAARVLGASGWGTFSYVLSLAALFTLFTDVGLGAVLTREMVRYPKQRAQYLSTSFFIKIVLLAFVVSIILLLSPYLTKVEIPEGLIILAVFIIIFDSLRMFSFSVIRALEKMHQEAIITVITQLAIVGLGFWVLFQKASIVNLAAAYAAGSAIGFLIVLWILRPWLKQIITGFDRRLVKKILTAAWPFALLGLFSSTMFNVDVVMIGWLRSTAEIGYYSISQKIVLVLYLLSFMIATAVFPALTRLANKNKAEFANLLVKTLKVIFIIAIPISVGGIITGFDIINTVFGAEYLPSVTAFRILLFGLLINYPAIVIGNALFAYNKQKEFVKYAIIGGVGNVIFNFALIPYWGIEGAAVSTVLTQIITNIFIWSKMKQTNYFSLRNQLNKILLANLVLGSQILLMHQFNVNFLIILISAIISYPIILYLMKEPSLKSVIELVWRKRA